MSLISVLPFEIGFIFLAVTAAIADYARMKIPNWVSLALVGLFVVYSMRLPAWTDIGWHVSIGAGVFLVAVLSYAFGFFGGGDVKLLGSIALWAGPEHIVDFLALTGLLGGALGVLILIARKAVRASPELADRPSAAWNIIRWGRDGLCPYGIPIALAALLTVPAMFTA